MPRKPIVSGTGPIGNVVPLYDKSGSLLGSFDLAAPGIERFGGQAADKHGMDGAIEGCYVKQLYRLPSGQFVLHSLRLDVQGKNTSQMTYGEMLPPLEAAAFLRSIGRKMPSDLEAVIRNADVTFAAPKAAIVDDPADRGGDSITALTAIEKAVQIYLRDTTLSVREVAKRVPCDPSLLYRDARFKALRNSYMGTIRKGRKLKDGSIEAAD